MTDKLIEGIQGGRYDRRGLENLLSNAERLGNEAVRNAAKAALQKVDVRSYEQRFVKPLREKVESIARDIAQAHGWEHFEGNCVGDGVKAGGRMRAGEELADYYFSFKHPSWSSASHFAVFQRDEQSPVRYRVKPHDGDELIFDTSEDAIARFRSATAAT